MKQQYVASWAISASEETNDKSYSDLDKTPLTLNTQLRMDESTSTKPKAHAYSDNKTITENPELLSAKEAGTQRTNLQAYHQTGNSIWLAIEQTQRVNLDQF